MTNPRETNGDEMSKTFDVETQSFVDHVREEGIDYTACNRTVGDAHVKVKLDVYLRARTELLESLGLDPRKW